MNILGNSTLPVVAVDPILLLEINPGQDIAVTWLPIAVECSRYVVEDTGFKGDFHLERLMPCEN